MKVDGVITNLLQGISQQQPSGRLPGQCTNQLNAVSDAVDGWKRRPPAEFIANLGAAKPVYSVWYFYNTGLEQYFMCIEPDGTLSVYDLDGTSYTVAGASALKAALSFTDSNDLSLVTVGDYTIISNAMLTPAMDTSMNESYGNTALIYLKDGGEYGRTYTIKLEGTEVAKYTTPGGATPATEASKTGTDYVTTALYNQMGAGTSLVQKLWTLNDKCSFNTDETELSFVADTGDAVASLDLAGAIVGDTYAITYEILAGGCTPTITGFCASTTLATVLGVHTVDVKCIADTKLTITTTGAGLVKIKSAIKLVNKKTSVHSAILSKYSIRKAGSIIELKRVTGDAIIDVFVTDDRGGQFANIVQRNVTKPSLLPKYATPGQIVQVTGEGASDKDDYYLKFCIEDGAEEFGTEGIWRECCCPGIPRKLDASTMPHALVRLPNGGWWFTPLNGSTYDYGTGTFEVERWRYRSAGDADSNPEPSFIGESITFVGTFQDRLYMLSDESGVFSATNSYFNFFNKTATTILDSDPVDMPSAGNSIVKLLRATVHDKSLVIFADKAQFIVSGTQPITPKSSMVLTTAYDSEIKCTPVVAGNSVLFPITYGDYSGLREFVTSSAMDTNSSQPITAHVPKLIDGPVKSMVVSSNFDTVLVQSTGDTSKLYVFEYLWQDGSRVQASWGVWSFSSAVAMMFIKDAYIYLVLNDGTTSRLERLDLTDVPPATFDYNIFIDSRVLVAPVDCTFTVPYVLDAADAVVVQGAGCTYPGGTMEIVSAVSTEGSTVITVRDVPTDSCYVGRKYTTLYEPTMPVIKDSNGGLINNAKLILGKMLVSYKDTGDFNALVLNTHYDDYLARYSGRTLGLDSNLVGQLSIASGVFPIPIRKDIKYTTIKIETSSHLPLNLVAIEWEGDYTKRGRRL